MTVSNTCSPKRSFSEASASREWTVRMSARLSSTPSSDSSRVEAVARELDHLHRLLDPLQREVLGLGGDQRVIGGDERVDGEQAERGRAVDQDQPRSRRQLRRARA